MEMTKEEMEKAIQSHDHIISKLLDNLIDYEMVQTEDGKVFTKFRPLKNQLNIKID